jgi:hypothetical protein
MLSFAAPLSPFLLNNTAEAERCRSKLTAPPGLLQGGNDVVAGWPATSWLRAVLQQEAAVAFLDTDAMAGADGNETRGSGDAVQNPAEASVVSLLAAGFLAAGVSPSEIGEETTLVFLHFHRRLSL